MTDTTTNRIAVTIDVNLHLAGDSTAVLGLAAAYSYAQNANNLIREYEALLDTVPPLNFLKLHCGTVESELKIAIDRQPEPVRAEIARIVDQLKGRAP
jgi:hypothetical protein